MQTEINFTEIAKTKRLQIFLHLVEQKKAEGYEARQFITVACAATLKKGNHWIMTIKHETDPAILLVAEYESTEPKTVIVQSRYHHGITYTRNARNWKLLNQYKIQA